MVEMGSCDVVGVKTPCMGDCRPASRRVMSDTSPTQSAVLLPFLVLHHHACSDPTHIGHHLNTMGDIYCLIWRLPPYHSYSHGLFSANNVPGINTFSINDRKLGELVFGVHFHHKRCLDLLWNHYLGWNSPFDPYGNNCKRATALESSRSLRI